MTMTDLPPLLPADRANIVAGLAGSTVALLAGENITSIRHALAALSAGSGVAIYVVPWAAEQAGVTSMNTIAALSFFSGLTGLQLAKLVMRYGPRAAFRGLAKRAGGMLDSTDQEENTQ